jgi:hypothetical protein
MIGLSARIRRDAARILNQGLLNTSPVLVLHEEPNAPISGTFDPLLESSYPETHTVSGTYPAFVHFVEPIKTGIRQFTEIQPGDVIFDFSATAPLSGVGLRFVLNDVTYVQKEVGNELAEYWDLLIEGQRHFRTVVATRKQ